MGWGDNSPTTISLWDHSLYHFPPLLDIVPNKSLSQESLSQGLLQRNSTQDNGKGSEFRIVLVSESGMASEVLRPARPVQAEISHHCACVCVLAELFGFLPAGQEEQGGPC